MAGEQPKAGTVAYTRYIDGVYQQMVHDGSGGTVERRFFSNMKVREYNAKAQQAKNATDDGAKRETGERRTGDDGKAPSSSKA